MRPRDDFVIMPVDFDYRDRPGWPKFSTDAAQTLYVGGSVTYLAMQLAYHMGITELYMVGFNHHYVIPKDAIIKKNDIESVGDDPNHFYKDYFGKGLKWHVPRTDRMAVGFARAKEHFEADGRRIINALVTSKLDTFPRVDVGEVLHRPIAGLSAVVCTNARTDERLRTLDLALTSVVTQRLTTLAFVELLVVLNTGDVAAYGAVLDAVVRARSRTPPGSPVTVRLLVEPELGLSHARNAGVAAATGAVVAFLDDDAEAGPEWAQAAADEMARDLTIAMVGGKIVPVQLEPADDDAGGVGGDDGAKLTKLKMDSAVNYGAQAKAIKWPQHLLGANVAFRKSVFSVVGTFSPLLGRSGPVLTGWEENLLSLRVAAAGYTILYTPAMTVSHHIGRARNDPDYLAARKSFQFISYHLRDIVQAARSEQVRVPLPPLPRMGCSNCLTRPDCSRAYELVASVRGAVPFPRVLAFAHAFARVFSGRAFSLPRCWLALSG